MNPNKAEAIQFLRSSIAGYRHKLDRLQRGGAEPVRTAADLARLKVEREQLNGLIADAKRLLSQLSTR
jgi:hypothetical protein